MFLCVCLGLFAAVQHRVTFSYRGLAVEETNKQLIYSFSFSLSAPSITSVSLQPNFHLSKAILAIYKDRTLLMFSSVWVKTWSLSLSLSLCVSCFVLAAFRDLLIWSLTSKPIWICLCDSSHSFVCHIPLTLLARWRHPHSTGGETHTWPKHIAFPGWMSIQTHTSTWTKPNHCNTSRCPQKTVPSKSIDCRLFGI